MFELNPSYLCQMHLYIISVSKNKIMHLMMNCYVMFMMYICT